MCRRLYRRRAWRSCDVYLGAISHVALGLGDAGIKNIPNEAPVLAAMQSNIKEAGSISFWP